jgi:hypothetical protein
MGQMTNAGPILDQYGVASDGYLAVNTTDKDFLFRSGTWFPVVKRKFLATDATLTSATLATIAGLSVPIAASATYIVEWRLWVNIPTATTTVNFSLLQTTFTSTQTAAKRVMASSATAEVMTQVTGTTTIPAFAAQTTLQVAANQVVDIQAFIISGATPGTLNLQHASDGTRTLTTYAGSYAEWNRMQ